MNSVRSTQTSSKGLVPYIKQGSVSNQSETTKGGSLWLSFTSRGVNCSHRHAVMQIYRVVKPGEPVALYDAHKIKLGAISGHVTIPVHYYILGDFIT